MAVPRTVRCPHCDKPRETRAQPRTRLRCPACSGHYLAPALTAAPADSQPVGETVEPVDVFPADGGSGQGPPAGTVGPPPDDHLGVDVAYLDSLRFPAAPVAPPAGVDGPGAEGLGLGAAPSGADGPRGSTGPGPATDDSTDPLPAPAEAVPPRPAHRPGRWRGRYRYRPAITP